MAIDTTGEADIPLRMEYSKQYRVSPRWDCVITFEEMRKNAKAMYLLEETRSGLLYRHPCFLMSDGSIYGLCNHSNEGLVVSFQTTVSNALISKPHKTYDHSDHLMDEWIGLTGNEHIWVKDNRLRHQLSELLGKTNGSVSSWAKPGPMECATACAWRAGGSIHFCYQHISSTHNHYIQGVVGESGDLAVIESQPKDADWVNILVDEIAMLSDDKNSWLLGIRQQ